MSRARGVLRAAVPVLVFAGALVLSVVSGRPARLPGAALGSVWLLHVERAALALGAVGTVWLVGWRALQGHFPVRLGNIEYSDRFEASTDAVFEAYEHRLQLLERWLELNTVLQDHVESDQLDHD